MAADLYPDAAPADAPARPGRWDTVVGTAVSVAVHLAIAIVLIQTTWRGAGGTGPPAETEVGVVAAPDRGPTIQSGAASLAASAIEAGPVQILALQPDVALEPLDDVGDLAVAAAPPAAMEAIIGTDLGGGGGLKGDWTGFAVGDGGGAGAGSWDGLVRRLRRNGFDIVLTFDSTGSMGAEIAEVKARIAGLGKALLALVPQARIGLCTYRDEGDDYVVRGLPLTSDVGALEAYLAGVGASGGGDEPESVHKALEWAMRQNDFRPQARKVILLFGDAPPHPQDVRTCIGLARTFHGQSGGIVSTVTCDRSAPMVRGTARRPADLRIPEFVRIAEAGGGEAFLITDHTKIVTQLMVLAFGSRHREKVIEALRLTAP